MWSNKQYENIRRLVNYMISPHNLNPMVHRVRILQENSGDTFQAHLSKSCSILQLQGSVAYSNSTCHKQQTRSGHSDILYPQQRNKKIGFQSQKAKKNLNNFVMFIYPCYSLLEDYWDPFATPYEFISFPINIHNSLLTYCWPTYPIVLTLISVKLKYFYYITKRNGKCFTFMPLQNKKKQRKHSKRLMRFYLLQVHKLIH